MNKRKDLLSEGGHTFEGSSDVCGCDWKWRVKVGYTLGASTKYMLQKDVKG